MGKRQSIYYAPGTSATTVNTGIVLRMTQNDPANWPLFELMNTTTNRVIGNVELSLAALREGDPGTIGFKRKLDALLSLLNVGLQTSVSQYQLQVA